MKIFIYRISHDFEKKLWYLITILQKVILSQQFIVKSRSFSIHPAIHIENLQKTFKTYY